MDNRNLLGDAPIGKLSGYKILVVDDDEEIRIFLTTLLSDEGAAVALTGRLAQYVVFIVGGLWALFSLRRRAKHPAT